MARAAEGTLDKKVGYSVLLIWRRGDGGVGIESGAASSLSGMGLGRGEFVQGIFCVC